MQALRARRVRSGAAKVFFGGMAGKVMEMAGDKRSLAAGRRRGRGVTYQLAKQGKLEVVLDRVKSAAAAVEAGAKAQRDGKKVTLAQRVALGALSSIGMTPEDLKGDDARSERTWRKANPGYGVTLQPREIENNFGRAKTPGDLAVVMRDHANVWGQAERKWLNMEQWKACGRLPYDREALAGRTCVMGLDLSRLIDITAAVLIFAPREAGEPWTILPHFWMPEETLRVRESQDRVSYVAWAGAGMIEATPGDSVDYAFVESRIEQWMETYTIREVAYDPHNASMLAQRLEGKGLKCVQIRQGPQSLNEPCKYLEKLLADRMLAHGDHEVMTWMAAKVLVKMDSGGRISPVKASKTSIYRIDGISALVTGLARAVVEEEVAECPYKDGPGLM